MHFEELRLFLHLAGTLHFGKTSRACHVSPSALSRAIQRLEGECGQALFQRNRRAVAMTEAGVAFRDFAASSVLGWKNLKAGLESRGPDLRGDFTIFCSVTASFSLLPRLLAEMNRRHPGVRILIRSGDANTAADRVLSGEADAAIAPISKRLPPRLVTRVIARTPLQFIAPRVEGAVRAAVKGKRIDWSQIPFVLPDSGLIRLHLQDWFRRKRLKPLIYSEVAGHETIAALVSLGAGVAVVPKLVLETGILLARVEVIPVQPALPDFIVGVCIDRAAAHRPLQRAFWSLIESMY
jgi:LysR family positive regulator for ilvC